MNELHAVTGAFGYSGQYIARRLLQAGNQVQTLTNSQRRPDPFQGKIRAFPLSFSDPVQLAKSLTGVKVLYNTYWVRFDHRDFSHHEAVNNTLTLFAAAKEAGVERIVHVSITNPSPESELPYFQGKAQLEEALTTSGLSYAVLRPTVLFGKEDILINNIAWLLRKSPVFGIFGDGNYRLQPIYVDDLAQLAVAQGALRQNTIINAIGPETFTYRGLVEEIGRIIGRKRPLISIPPVVGYAASRLLSTLLDDVLITREEIDGLMADLLYVAAPPTGATRLTAWIQRHAASLGRNYTSELARRRDRQAAYQTN